jgi:sugar diacid utilization regulator
VSEQQDLRARVQNEFERLVAVGAPREELVTALETALACHVNVLGAEDAVNEHALGYPIVPGTEVLGRLQSDIPIEHASAEFADCLVYAARIIGIELVRERAGLEARWSFEADLLTELIEAGAGVPARLSQRARHSGFDLTRSWHFLLLAVDDGSAASEILAAARRPAIADEHSMCCMHEDRLAVAVCEQPQGALDAKLRHLDRVARGLGAALQIGVSSTVTDFACGLLQAQAALQLATCGDRTSTVYHEELGSLRFVLNGLSRTELTSMVELQLGPLAEHDRERHGELLATLRVYLDEGGRLRRAAERCHVHQSTMKYRLRRIHELLECDLADANVRFDLMLAVKILDLLRGVDADPMARRPLQPA